MKHVKPTQEKEPTQIIIFDGADDLPGNKSSNEIHAFCISNAFSIEPQCCLTFS